MNIYIYMGAQKYDGQEQPSHRASRLLKLWIGVMSSSPFKPQRRWPLAVQTLCDILAPRSFCPPKMWMTWEPRRAEVGETSSWDTLSTWRISKSHLHNFRKFRRLPDTQWNSNCQPKKEKNIWNKNVHKSPSDLWSRSVSSPLKDASKNGPGGSNITFIKNNRWIFFCIKINTFINVCRDSGCEIVFCTVQWWILYN